MKSRVNPRYIGVSTELDDAIRKVHIDVKEALPDRSMARLMRLLLWAGLEITGLAIPPDYEIAEIRRLTELIKKV